MASVDRRIGDTNHSVIVSLTVKPSDDVTWKTGSSKRPKFHITPSKDSTLAERPLLRHHIKAVENGITSGLSKGNILTMLLNAQCIKPTVVCSIGVVQG